jgi:hypothetical protein
MSYLIKNVKIDQSLHIYTIVENSKIYKIEINQKTKETAITQLPHYYYIEKLTAPLAMSDVQIIDWILHKSSNIDEDALIMDRLNF